MRGAADEAMEGGGGGASAARMAGERVGLDGEERRGMGMTGLGGERGGDERRQGEQCWPGHLQARLKALEEMLLDRASRR